MAEEVILKLKTDLEGALKDLESIKASLENVDETTKKTAKAFPVNLLNASIVSSIANFIPKKDNFNGVNAIVIIPPKTFPNASKFSVVWLTFLYVSTKTPTTLFNTELIVSNITLRVLETSWFFVRASVKNSTAF